MAAAPNNARRHVIFLNRRDSSHPERGGSEVFLERVAEHLLELDWRVTVMCAQHPGAAPDIELRGVRYIRSGGDLGLYFHAARAVLGQRRGFGPLGPADVIVDVQNGMPFCSPLLTRTPVVNLVHHVHREQWQVVLPGIKGRVGWLLESRLAPRVYRRSVYVAVSPATRDELARLGVTPSQVRVVYNGTDVRPVPDQLRAARPTVLAVSRLVPHKRLDLAVSAAAQLRGRVPDLRLVIAGMGYWENELRVQIRQLGLTDCVELVGWVDEEQKHRLMAEAWVMAAPSLKEGWGLSVIEAAAHGTPSVAFHGAGGLSDSIVNGKTGLLVHGGVDEFSAGLERVLTDRDLREQLQAAARAHATAFTWAGTAASMARVIDEAAQNATDSARKASSIRRRSPGAARSAAPENA